MTVPVKAALAAVLAVVSCAACGGGGPAAARSPAPSPRPSGPARLTILAPSSGEVIHGPTVHLKVRMTVAKAGSPAATKIAPVYLHTYVDSKIVSITIASLADGVTEQTVRGLKPGRHLLRVELVGPNHLPFNPRVIANVTFVAKR